MTALNKKYFIISLGVHAFILLALILGFDFATPLIVIENTNKQDIISAVMLGDTEKSKILTLAAPAPKPDPVQTEAPLKKVEPEIKKEVIALEPPKKKTPNIFGKDLLKDIEQFKKVAAKKKQIKQNQLKEHFEKTLRHQTEKSMRQQLLNEHFTLKSTTSREAQGIVNKYQALIQQAISEHWVIPSQANKKLYSLLLIRLAPGGIVLDVQITKSSGDPALDNSARAAVFKASPLPVPNEPAAFESFRQFNLKARPENIIE